MLVKNQGEKKKGNKETYVKYRIAIFRRYRSCLLFVELESWD